MKLIVDRKSCIQRILKYVLCINFQFWHAINVQCHYTLYKWLVCEITLTQNHVCCCVCVYSRVCERAVRFSGEADVLTFMTILVTRIKTLQSL